MIRRFLVLVLLALAACRTEEPTPTSAPPTTTTAVAAKSEAPEATGEEPQPEFGAIGSVDVEQGGTYWAAYLAVGEQGAPELEQATDYLANLGVESVAGELACDRGAAKALGLSEDLLAVGAYFAERADAQAFSKKLPTPPAGVAMVTTYCAD